MATSVTIDNLDSETLRRLQEEAQRCGRDMGTVAGEILKKGLLRRSNGPVDHAGRNLEDLTGTWSEKEAEAFLSIIADFEHVDQDLWR